MYLFEHKIYIQYILSVVNIELFHYIKEIYVYAMLLYILSVVRHEEKLF